jgi:hypothetical protein
MKIDGGCFCGQVTYEAEIDPARVAICHCADCQINSGTAYGVIVPVDNDAFTLLTGTLKTHVKVAESGNRRALNFCPECGTRVHAHNADGDPGFIGLRVGTANQRDQLKPNKQAWTRSALSWVEDLSGIQKFELQPDLSK